MELAEKIVYWVFQNITWVVVFTSLFEKRESGKFKFRFLQVVILSCAQMLTGVFAYTSITLIQLSMLVIFYLTVWVEHKLHSKKLMVEVTFSFAIKELLRITCSTISTFFCVFILQTNNWIAITVASIPLLVLAWVVCRIVCKRRDFSALAEKSSAGIFALIFTLLFIALDTVQAPYKNMNNEFFAFVLSICAVSCVLLVLWANREHKVLEEQARLAAELETIALERDDLRSENHRLGKVLPGLEEQYGEMKRWADQLRQERELSDFSEELVRKQETTSALCGQINGERARRADMKTGLDVLDGVIQHAAHRAETAGICFGCHVFGKADGLLTLPGTTELSLQQILSNLLDNAINAALRSKREPKIVTCYMGMSEDGYRIEALDSGDPFPAHVLQNLGSYGNTEGGNGIGLVHTMEALSECGASLIIEEFSVPRLTGAAKSVAVCFDGKAIAHLPYRGPGGETMRVGIELLLRKNGHARKREDHVCMRSQTEASAWRE